MITNKDISIDSENGKITLNGNKYDLGTQGEIDTAVKDVYTVMGQNGAKNLIPYPYVNKSQTINNVEFTVNGDGSISADNAASAITQFRLYGWTTGLSPMLLKKGTYILSGCPSGGGANTILLYLHNQDSTINIVDDGEGAKFTLSDDTYIGIAIRVANGYDADGKTIYPMIRLATDTDNTYEPYAMTNKQLTEQIADVKGTIGDITQTGVTGASVAAQLETLDGKITALPVIVSGQADFPAAAIGSQEIEVLFPAGVFTSAPIVTATMSDTTPFSVGAYMEADLYVYNVTKDSFFLHGTRKNSNYTWKANWIAVQM